MKLKNVRAPVLVGLVILGSLAGLMYMVSKIKTSTVGGPDTYVVHATFQDVTGLVRRSTVTMVGTPVGVIEDIRRVDTDEGVKARVTIRLSPDVALYAGEVREGHLTGAASVLRKQSSILGDFYLSLSPGLFGDRLEDGDEIPIVIGTSGIEAVLDQMTQWSTLYPRLDRILANVEDVTASMSKAMGGDEQSQALGELVRNIRDISVQIKEIGDRARTVSAEIERLVDEGTVTRIANNLEDTTADARDIASRIQEIVSAGDVQELVRNLTETTKQLNSVGVQLGQVVQEGITPRISQLNRIFHNFERFSRVVAEFSEGQQGTVKDMLANFREFSQELVTLARTSRGDVETAIGSVRSTLETAQLSLRRLDETMENVRAITADLRAGKGTIGRLLTDDRLVEEVEEVVTDTKEFVKSYTLMQTEVQLASSVYLEEYSSKNVFSIRFRPKVDKYYLLQLVDDPRGRLYEETIETATDAPGETPVVTERVRTTTHDLKFSFQFAKSWYFLTGRFGIMESTGGLGLDFNFFRDRLAFQFDLFDFTLANNPRLRSQVEWEIFRHFFVAAGADDIMNDMYRDYYFSAGLRFTDDDLKALLLASPPVSP